MIDLQINVDSIRRSKSGQITGVLFLRINNLIFPEEGWNDFIVVVLGFWVSEVLKNWNLDILGDFRFMDGPIRFQIAKIGNKTEFTGFNDKKLILQEEIDYSSFKNSLIDIAFKVVRIVEEKKWESKDIDFLKDQLSAVTAIMNR